MAIGFIFFIENSTQAFTVMESVHGVGSSLSGPIGSYFYYIFGFRGPYFAFAVTQAVILTLNFFFLDKNKVDTNMDRDRR